MDIWNCFGIGAIINTHQKIQWYPYAKLFSFHFVYEHDLIRDDVTQSLNKYFFVNPENVGIGIWRKNM